MDEPSLRDYVTALRRRRMVVLGTVLAVTFGALALSLLQTEQFKARAELLVRQTPSEELLLESTEQSGRGAERRINNELRLAEAKPMREAVADEYDGPLDPRIVKAQATAENADVIELSAVASDPEAATELVNTYVETYVSERRRQQVDDLLGTGSNIQEQIDEVTASINEAEAPLVDLDLRIAGASDAGTAANLQSERERLADQIQPRIDALEAQRLSYQDQLERVQARADLTESGGVQILALADEPGSPISPKPVRNVVVGAVAGILLGIALALLIEHLDDSVRSKEDAERITAQPTLGLIPRLPARRDRQVEIVSIDDPSSNGAEAYRSLRTSVKFLGVDRPLRTILVTSAAASEGKTVTAANLAIVLAQAGERVLLVSADLRRPRVEELFGAPTSPGLTSLLLDELPTAAAVFEVGELPNLHLMPAGPTPPNPAELLGGDRAETLLRSLAETYDSVIIDSPPVLPVTDAQVLSRHADAVLLVVAFDETSRRGLARSMELLEHVDAPVVGTVLNLTSTSAAYGGQPYRYTTYKSRSERRRQRVLGAVTRGPVTPAHSVGRSDADAVPAGAGWSAGAGPEAEGATDERDPA